MHLTNRRRSGRRTWRTWVSYTCSFTFDIILNCWFIRLQKIGIMTNCGRHSCIKKNSWNATLRYLRIASHQMQVFITDDWTDRIQIYYESVFSKTRFFVKFCQRLTVIVSDFFSFFCVVSELAIVIRRIQQTSRECRILRYLTPHPPQPDSAQYPEELIRTHTSMQQQFAGALRTREEQMDPAFATDSLSRRVFTRIIQTTAATGAINEDFMEMSASTLLSRQRSERLFVDRVAVHNRWENAITTRAKTTKKRPILIVQFGRHSEFCWAARYADSTTSAQLKTNCQFNYYITNVTKIYSRRGWVDEHHATAQFIYINQREPLRRCNEQ